MKPVTHTENEPVVVSRITEQLIRQGKTQTELLSYLGLHGNNYSEWKAGRKRSYLLYIDEIARYLSVSPTYLLRGEEYDAMITRQEQKLVKIYRGLDSESKEKLMGIAVRLGSDCEAGEPR